MKKATLALSAASMAAAILLMILLKGVSMAFASGPLQYKYESYAYFDLMPLGYGNWLPLIAAALACLALVFILLTLFSKTRSAAPKKTPLVLSAISIAASLLSFVLFNSMNAASLAIVALGALSILLQFLFYKKQLKP
jgi:hypothetical protein